MRTGFSADDLVVRLRESVGVRGVKLYRINKLANRDGSIIKKKDILATSDREAVKQAADSPDCPVCDVLRDGRNVGSIV